MSQYRIQTVQISKQTADAFSTFLYWWDEIRKYYKDHNYHSVCFDVMHQNMVENFCEIEEQTN